MNTCLLIYSCMMATKRKLSTLSYKEKYDIIKFCDDNLGMKKTDIAAKFNIPRPTLFDIRKNRQKIISDKNYEGKASHI